MHRTAAGRVSFIFVREALRLFRLIIIILLMSGKAGMAVVMGRRRHNLTAV